jgi:hypothetical protein
MQFIDFNTSFEEDHHSGVYDTLIIQQSQEIPDEWISRNKLIRANSLHTREGEFMHVAEIPVVIVEKWLREGFDINKEPIRDILRRLRKEELEACILTNKRV